MAKRLPYIPLYYKDFIAGTLSMKAEEVGAYLLLLIEQWRAGYLPTDTKELRKIARCSNRILQKVLEKFSKSEKDSASIELVFRNEKLEEVRRGDGVYRAKQKENGGKGGRPKTQTKPTDNPNETQTEPNHKPKQKPPIASAIAIANKSESAHAGESETLEENPFPTLEQVLEYGQMPQCAMIAEHCRTYFDKRSAIGWVDGQGRRIVDWQADMRSWKVNQHRFNDKPRVVDEPPIEDDEQRRRRIYAEMAKRKRDEEERTKECQPLPQSISP